VQRLLPGEEWDREIAIHLTPQLGINVRYPSSSTRPFLNDQRGEMHHNYDAGTPIHMTVFLASKKLDTSASSTDWDWIRCGLMTQVPVPYPLIQLRWCPDICTARTDLSTRPTPLLCPR